MSVGGVFFGLQAAVRHLPGHTSPNAVCCTGAKDAVVGTTVLEGAASSTQMACRANTRMIVQRRAACRIAVCVFFLFFLAKVRTDMRLKLTAPRLG
jgi:hypothetical protein